MRSEDLELDRLTRLLNLVPYFQSHPRATKMQAAQHFGISPAELGAELRLLWTCGLPGGGPADLIDLEMGADTVAVTFSAGLDRPLQLTAAEATVLLAALDTLAGRPDIADNQAVDGATATLRHALGEHRDETPTSEDVTDSFADVLSEALRQRRAVSLRYTAATSGETTQRVIDPLTLFSKDRQRYLLAWCRRAQGPRSFRLDRIDAADLLDEPAQDHDLAAILDTDVLPSLKDASLPRARLRITKELGWIVPYHPIEVYHYRDDGLIDVDMVYANEEWMAKFILSLGEQVVGVGPAQLAHRVQEYARAVSAAANLTIPGSPE